MSDEQAQPMSLGLDPEPLWGHDCPGPCPCLRTTTGISCEPGRLLSIFLCRLSVFSQ